MTALILGADGTIGWPLTCLLAQASPEPLVLVDDLSRRRRVAGEGYQSALPLPTLADRVERLRRVSGRDDLQVVVASLADCAAELVREHRPTTVFHLAQIPSAPFSMKSAQHALETIRNNEEGNLALLFALRDHAPEAHLVKMGSMGEYAPCGVPIAEGYVEAVLDGQATSEPVPFPRSADDVYHITKINDSNFVAMATRVWGLAATDVMQSVVYGIHTELSRQSPELCTRFDCDPTFGTVVNRMVAQAILGRPLTVYGDGHQTTGLIHLDDSVRALQHWAESPARRGEHRVVNQATEVRISIRELAELVRRVGATRGAEVTITQEFDPRHERGGSRRSGDICNRTLRETGLALTGLEEGVGGLWDDLAPHADRLANAIDPPYVDWQTGDAHGGRISLNPGMLSDVRPRVRSRMEGFGRETARDPLGAYMLAREDVGRLRIEAAETFGGDSEGWAFVHGHTTAVDRVAWSLVELLRRGGSPIRLVTTLHEHPGGIGAFVDHPAFTVERVAPEVLPDTEGDVYFLSHLTYDLNLDLSPQIAALSQRGVPVIVDGCQAVGQVPVDVGALGCDAYLASTHKWLGGPQGAGILYLHPAAREAWPVPVHSGVPLATDLPIGRWEPRGGLDFAAIRGVREALAAWGETSVRAAPSLRDRFLAHLEAGEAPVRVRHPEHPGAVTRVAVLELPGHDVYQVYQELRRHGVSVKCIKDEARQLLRLGFPYWLSEAEVDRAARILGDILGG